MKRVGEVERRLIITRQYPPLTHFQSSSTLTAAARLQLPHRLQQPLLQSPSPISATASRLPSLAPAPALISAPPSIPVFRPVCGAGFVSDSFYDSFYDSVSVPDSVFGLVFVCSVASISMLVSVLVYRAVSSEDSSTVSLSVSVIDSSTVSHPVSSTVSASVSVLVSSAVSLSVFSQVSSP